MQIAKIMEYESNDYFHSNWSFRNNPKISLKGRLDQIGIQIKPATIQSIILLNTTKT